MRNPYKRFESMLSALGLRQRVTLTSDSLFSGVFPYINHFLQFLFMYCTVEPHAEFGQKMDDRRGLTMPTTNNDDDRSEAPMEYPKRSNNYSQLVDPPIRDPNKLRSSTVFPDMAIWQEDQQVF